MTSTVDQRFQWRCDMARGMYVLCEIEGVLANASHRKSVSDADAGQLIAGDELIFPPAVCCVVLLSPRAEVVLYQ